MRVDDETCRVRIRFIDADKCHAWTARPVSTCLESHISTSLRKILPGVLIDRLLMTENSLKAVPQRERRKERPLIGLLNS